MVDSPGKYAFIVAFATNPIFDVETLGFELVTDSMAM